MYYFEQEGQFKGKLEVTQELASLLRATPPTGLEESTLWEYCWNTVAFGVQAELDKAEKALMDEAMIKSKGSSKGYSMGKGKVHWSSPFIYSSSWNPYPIPMVLEVVEAISYSWDEYCDKFSGLQSCYFLWSSGYTATRPKSFRPFHSSTPEGSPSLWKGKSDVLRRCLHAFCHPQNGPVLVSFPWATPPIKSQQIQSFQWLPLPCEFFQRSWRLCCGFGGRQAQSSNLAGSKLPSYNATSSSHQNYLHRPLKCCYSKDTWDRSPVRRKDFRNIENIEPKDTGLAKLVPTNDGK